MCSKILGANLQAVAMDDRIRGLYDNDAYQLMACNLVLEGLVDALTNFLYHAERELSQATVVHDPSAGTNHCNQIQRTCTRKQNERHRSTQGRDWAC